MQLDNMYEYIKNYLDKKLYVSKANFKGLFDEYNVKAVADDLDVINNVGSNIDNINACSDSITDINTCNEYMDDITAVSDDIGNIDKVSSHVNNIDTTANSIGNVDTVAGHINNVNNVGNSISKVDIVSNNISNVVTVSNDVSNINITANSIDNVNTYAKTYYGVNTENPTSRPDGSDCLVGDMFFNTTISKMKVYNNDNVWVLASSAVNGIIKSGRFIGDGNTKSFAVEGGYDANFGIVFLNGTEVTPDVDISDGQNIVFNSAPDSNDNIDYNMFGSFRISNTVDLNSNQTITGTKTFSQDINMSDENKGLTLVDRSDTSKTYRLYVDDGNLGIEEI